MSRTSDIQAVYDRAHELGILDEPQSAASTVQQGVQSARIEETPDGPILVEVIQGRKGSGERGRA